VNPSGFIMLLPACIVIAWYSGYRWSAPLVGLLAAWPLLLLAALGRTAGLRRAEAAARERGRALLASVGLSEYAEAPAAILSYGQRKLLSIAASMMARPKLIVLDEPVAGVNPTLIRGIDAVIRALNAQGVSFIIIEHNVEFVMSLCRRVIVLESGARIADGPPALIRSDPRVLAAYLGKTRASELAGGRG